MSRALAVSAGAAVFALIFSGAVCAHEIGTTRVSVVFERDESYRIDVVTDAAALVDKLIASTGRASFTSTSTDPAELRAQIASFEEIFRRRVAVRFDGAESRPAIEYLVVPPVDALSAPAATIRLTGAIPPGSRGFAWSYGWTFASYALIARRGDAAQPVTQWLEGGDASKAIPIVAPIATVGRFETARRYLSLGFTHIVPKGVDHMLFVLGIFLLTRRLRPVLWQVSAFTIAHSITLGLSIYGVISVAPAIVEPLIALSIVYVAIENLFMAELKPWRVGLVFAFGLLHGMGFAGALKELGLPRSEFMTALLTFNLGVEAGQLAVIAAAFLAIGWWFGRRVWYRRLIVVPASALIACIALYWTVQRLSM